LILVTLIELRDDTIIDVRISDLKTYQ
jgi:hypothetical protein